MVWIVLCCQAAQAENGEVSVALGLSTFERWGHERLKLFIAHLKFPNSFMKQLTCGHGLRGKC